MPTAAGGALPPTFLTSPDMLFNAELWFYRFGDFFVTSILDDPAWLALVFC